MICHICINDMIFEFSAVSSIDTSGVSLFKELKVTLKIKGVEVRFLNCDKLIHLHLSSTDTFDEGMSDVRHWHMWLHSISLLSQINISINISVPCLVFVCVNTCASWQFRIHIWTMANWNNLWQLILVNPLAEVIGKLKKADEDNDFLRSDYLFLTVGEAVAALSSAIRSRSQTIEERE